MSEKLTAGELIEKKYRTCILCQSTKWVIRDAMEEYAAQQVQLIKEERDKVLHILKQANSILNISGYTIEPWSPFAERLQDYITSIK